MSGDEDDEDDEPNGNAAAAEANGGNRSDSGVRGPRGRRGDRSPAVRAARSAATERDRAQEQRIEELLKEGQEILVQVAKEPLGTKGARLTSHVTLPGRFLVFMPTVDHIGVSRKIATREERQRLRGIVREFREQNNFSGGVIIRTAAEGRSKEDILSDLQYFHRIWMDMRQRTETHRAPAVVYREPSLVAKLLRDLLTDDYTAIRIDNAQEYQRVLEFIERIMPALAPRVKLYDKDYPIFEEYGVQPELDKALRSKVWLKSGGSIVINQTEALVAIDVNTGRYVGQEDSRPSRRHDPQDQSRSGQGDHPPDPPARPRRHHRPRLHRHGREEEPPEGFPGGRAGAAQGPRAVEAAAGVRLRPRDHHAQARQAEPRARAHRAVPVLHRRRHDQIELDDLLRDPVRD